MTTLKMKGVVITIVCGMLVVGVIGYFIIFAPLDLSITEVRYDRWSDPVTKKPTDLYVLWVFVTYRNNGLIDLTVTGEIDLRIDGTSAYSQHMEHSLFLLHPGESETFDASPKFGNRGLGSIPENQDRFQVEVIAFLTVNGQQRTLTATYEFHR